MRGYQPMSEPVMILCVGVKWESVTIYGIEISKDEWRFNFDTQSLNHPDFEDSNLLFSTSEHRSEENYTWEEIAGRLVKKYSKWIDFEVEHVHEQFRQQIWEAVLECCKNIDIDEWSVSRWVKVLRKWATLCHKPQPQIRE